MKTLGFTSVSCKTSSYLHVPPEEKIFPDLDWLKIPKEHSRQSLKGVLAKQNKKRLNLTRSAPQQSSLLDKSKLCNRQGRSGNVRESQHSKQSRKSLTCLSLGLQGLNYIAVWTMSCVMFCWLILCLVFVAFKAGK